MDIAVIGLQAHSLPIKEATNDLDRMTGASKRTEAANNQRAKSDHAAAAAANANAAATRALAAASNMAAFRQRQLAVQSLDVAQSLALGMPPMMVAIQQGGQIAGIYAGQGGVAGAFREAAGAVMRFVRAHPLLIAAQVAIGAAFVGIRNEINATSGQTVSFGNVFQATINVAASAIGSILAPAINTIAPYFAAAWNAVVAATKGAINIIIGAGVGSVKAILAAWSQFPDAMGDVAFSAANSFIIGIKEMAREAILIVGDVIDAMNGALGTSIARPKTSVIKQGGINNPFAGSGSGMADAASAAFMEGMNFDYAGAAFGAIRDEAIRLAQAQNDVEKASGRAGRATKESADSGLSAMNGLVTKALEVKDAYLKAQAEIASTIKAATNELGTSVGGILKGLLDKTLSWKDAAIQAVVQVLSYMNKLNVARGGSGLFGGGFFQSLIGGLVGIPGFASGTNSAPGGLAMVGERGPELVNLPRGSQVVPASQSRQMMQPNIRLVVNNTFDGEAIRTVVRDESGRVVAQAAPGIVSQSVSAVGQRRRTHPGY